MTGIWISATVGGVSGDLVAERDRSLRAVENRALRRLDLFLRNGRHRRAGLTLRVELEQLWRCQSALSMPLTLVVVDV
jgi:hypothetical protein